MCFTWLEDAIARESGKYSFPPSFVVSLDETARVNEVLECIIVAIFQKVQRTLEMFPATH